MVDVAQATSGQPRNGGGGRRDCGSTTSDSCREEKNIRTLIKQVWLGETYTSVSVPVGCDLLTYDDVVSWYIEQKEVGTNHFKYCKQWLAGNVSALVYLYDDMAGMTMPGIRKTIV